MAGFVTWYRSSILNITFTHTIAGVSLNVETGTLSEVG